MPHTVNIPDTWPSRLIERSGLIVVSSNNKRINADPFSIHGFVYINCPRAIYSKVPWKNIIKSWLVFVLYPRVLFIYITDSQIYMLDAIKKKYKWYYAFNLRSKFDASAGIPPRKSWHPAAGGLLDFIALLVGCLCFECGRDCSEQRKQRDGKSSSSSANDYL